MQVLCVCKRTFYGVLFALLSYPANAQTDALTLSEALERAGASPSIAVAEAEVDIARGNQRQAGLGPNPEISVEVENIAGTGVFRGLQSTEATVTFGQRIELGGKEGARVDAARAETRVAEIRAEIVRADLAQQVRERFAEAVASRQRVMLAGQAVARAEELSRVANLLVETGREPPLRALRAGASLGEAEAVLVERIAEDENARRLLAALWGGEAPPQAVDEGAAVVYDESLGGRPQSVLAMQLADAELNAAEAVIDRERSLRTPDLTLSGGVRRNEEANAHGFLVGASMSLPFGNRNQGAIEAAQASARAAEARRSQLLVEAARTIATSRATLAAAEERVATLENRTLPQAEEALRLADIGYRAGRFSLVELLDASEARDAALGALIDARLTRDRALASLIRATAQ